MNKALLLIDIQNDYFSNERNPLLNAEQVAEQAASVLADFPKLICMRGLQHQTYSNSMSAA